MRYKIVVKPSTQKKQLLTLVRLVVLVAHKADCVWEHWDPGPGLEKPQGRTFFLLPQALLPEPSSVQGRGVSTGEYLRTMPPKKLS